MTLVKGGDETVQQTLAYPFSRPDHSYRAESEPLRRRENIHTYEHMYKWRQHEVSVTQNISGVFGHTV